MKSIEIPKIEDAIGKPGRILPKSLDGYSPIDGAYTLYEQYAGSFCIVYPLKHVRKSIPDKCLRVWYNIVDINLVKTVSNYFKSRRCPYVMNYEYYDEALRLDSGEKIPGVVMDWVHGKTLHSYVKDNRNNSAAITKVASQFLEMAKSMKSLGISHGDLSGDNIMVRNDGTLMLIDYDSFFVPGMASNVLQTTMGTAGYQHPRRSSSRYLTNWLDNFSQQVIYLSLLCYAKNGRLAQEDSGYIGDKELLFQGMDLMTDSAFISSKGYKVCNGIKDSKIQSLLAELRKSIGARLDLVKSIADIEIEKPAVRLVPYCIKCGYKFPNPSHKFCIMCGAERLQFG
ncbi:protein kinase domain-containing protein [Lepagella muris]|uniref:Uncharacterized protein n=1 Tax=Lepagella muris TaxID=3032870 RepID=A0AC61RD17_9BACT|nr:RIO1 family regulatory kinase/ATPase [Lepagella muris]TGY76642.1 hypothetical protein E5331_17525 [Lepagella muris]THG48192.1 hypothetical protein E5984_16775 [Bacteroidales bacterium]TKC54386.1 hypothetical protein E5359_018650 [Bacteroidales bacterium]